MPSEFVTVVRALQFEYMLLQISFSARSCFADHTSKSFQELIVAPFFDYKLKDSCVSFRRSSIFFDITSLHCSPPKSKVLFFSKSHWKTASTKSKYASCTSQGSQSFVNVDLRFSVAGPETRIHKKIQRLGWSVSVLALTSLYKKYKNWSCIPSSRHGFANSKSACPSSGCTPSLIRAISRTQISVQGWPLSVLTEIGSVSCTSWQIPIDAVVYFRFSNVLHRKMVRNGQS